MAGDSTAVDRPERWICDGEPSERYPIWTRGNVGEVFPWPVTPATWSLGVIQCSEPGWRDALERFGAFDQDEFSSVNTEIIGCFGGYCYLNAAVTRILGVRTPGLTPEQMDYSLWGEMPGVPPYQPMEGDDDPSKTERIQATLGWIFSVPELTDLEADRLRMADLRASRPDFDAMSDAEIVAWYRGHAPELRRLFAEHLYISYCSSVPLGVIQGVCTAIGDPTLAMTLVSGIGGVDSAAPSYAFWEMGRLVRGSASLTAAFDAGVDGLLERLRGTDDPDANAFLKAFDDFTYEFGSRGPNEWETSAPSWETDPELPLAAIDRMRLADDDQAPRRHQEAMAEAREAAIPKVLAAVEGDPETHGQLSAALAAAPVFLAGRERTKTNIIRLVNEMRVGSHALGQRMVERGYYTKPTSGSMLNDDELDRFLADPEPWVEVIKAREAQYEVLFDLEPPFVFDGEVPPLRTWQERSTAPTPVATGTTLEGIPGCPGLATGRARVVLDPSDPTALEPGDVLIAPITDPAWTPLFVPAAAVVVDVGAQLSHAVIVSRELGIPCVVSVTNGTRLIPDGAQITVDGTAGTVTVH
jgi:pyruvate,water dikinase